METNDFILSNLKEGESCKEMIMGDIPLFTQNHFDTIKQLIEENKLLTHIGTRVYFRQSSINHDRVVNDQNGEGNYKLDNNFYYDVTIITKINRDLSLHLMVCDIIEKIYVFVKPTLRFH